MTWSIVARDAEQGLLGIAVSTCAFAVGSRVPFIETGVGAIASQAFVNPYYGLRGLELMRAGATPSEVIPLVTRPDEGREHRQMHAIDIDGRQGAYTGSQCLPWCGHMTFDGYSVAGNMLANDRVVPETARVFAESSGPMATRMLLALRAGEAAGGDSRGRQSAAILIHDAEIYALLDIRVDDHPDPLEELARLEAESRRRFVHYRKFMPSRSSPSGIVDRDELERAIERSIAAD